MKKKFVLWGHRLSEYQDMFDIDDTLLTSKKFLDVGSGVTSFNADMHERGLSVTSVDQLYGLSIDRIHQVVEDVFETTLSKIKANVDRYTWKKYEDITDLVTHRRQGIQRFFDDFESGKKDGRYVAPDADGRLPFDDFSFELGLSAHHLFVNFDDRGVNEHVQAICRVVAVAEECRIFPLLDKYGQVSPLLGPVMLELQKQQMGLEVRQVASQLQKGGNAMLRVWATQCDVTDNV